MATITSATSGLASAGGTWVGGIAPVEGDKVVIPHAGTAFSQFTTDATGYAIGATAITLTGSVAAGSYVIGETVRFGTDINNYTITNWVSGTKVLTVTALAVAIPAAATTVYNDGHMVTIDGTYIWGDDTTTAIQLQGRLRFSRTVNSSLTVKGNITSTATTWPNGVWVDRGYEADPIPSGVTSTFISNYSAVMANNKYSVNWQWGWRWTEWGATKTPWSRMVGAISAGAVSLVVDNATGWAVGDLICIADTGTGVAYQGDIKTISSVAGTTIGFAATTFAHATRCVVANYTRNVKMKPHSTSFGTEFRINLTSLGISSTGTEGRYELGYCAFEDMGYQGGVVPGVRFDVRDEQLVNSPILRIMYGVSSYVTAIGNTVGNGNVQIVNTAGTTNPYPIQFCVFLPSNNSQSTGLTGLKIDSASCDVSDTWILSGLNSTMSFGPNVPYSTWTRGGIASGAGIPWFIASSGIQLTDVDFGSCARVQFNGAYDLKFTNCRFGTGSGNGKINNDAQYFSHGGAGFVSDFTLTDCYLNLTSYTENQLSTTPWSMAQSDSTMRFIRPNGEDRTEYKRKNGTMYSENSVNNRSNRAIKFAQSSNYGADGLYYNIPIPVTAGTLVTVIGYLRKDSAYGSSNLPSATLSGQGGTPATFTMTNSVDTYEKFTLTMTPATTGSATLKIQGKSANGAVGTPVVFYCDGVVLGNFNTFSRHYGYEFDFNPYVTINPYITQTNEATVGAYTGISVNHSTNTITLSSNHSITELYDYCYYNLCQTANLAEPEFFTTADGINYSSTYNLVINTAVSLTGSGALTLTGGATLTMTGTAQSDIDITHTSGTKVWTRVTLSGIVANSRVQLYKTATTTELYNGVPGTSVTYQIEWSGDTSIRYRIAYQSGTTAKEFIEANATLTSSGASVTIAQVDDAVYIANAIDGSTVTGITFTDAATDLVNIDIASGATTWPRIYAAFVYWIFTSAGIADDIAYVQAADTANYTLTSMKIKNTSSPSVPLQITGGYGVDSVTGESVDLIDTTGGTLLFAPNHVVAYESSQSALTTLASKIIVSSSRL